MKKVGLICILFTFIMIQSGCEAGESAPPNEPEEGLKITEVKFGASWDAVNNDVTDIDTVFNYGINKIFYKIEFNQYFSQGYRIRKIWELNEDTVLKVVNFSPVKTYKICGEFHHRYDTTAMDTGAYEISIYYFSKDEYKYIEFPYDTSVNRRFKIQ